MIWYLIEKKYDIYHFSFFHRGVIGFTVAENGLAFLFTLLVLHPQGRYTLGLLSQECHLLLEDSTLAP